MALLLNVKVIIWLEALTGSTCEIFTDTMKKVDCIKIIQRNDNVFLTLIGQYLAFLLAIDIMITLQCNSKSSFPHNTLCRA